MKDRQLVTFGVPRSMHSAMRRVAADEGKSVAAILRTLMATAIERNIRGQPATTTAAA